MHEKSILVPTLELAKKNQHLNWIHPGITNEQFPIPNRLCNKYKVFLFNKRISSDNAIAVMCEKGYEPANSHELLSWKEWNESNVVVALDAVTKTNNHRRVLSLRRHGARKFLNLESWDTQWDSYYLFLAVYTHSVHSHYF